MVNGDVFVVSFRTFIPTNIIFDISVAVTIAIAVIFRFAAIKVIPFAPPPTTLKPTPNLRNNNYPLPLQNPPALWKKQSDNKIKWRGRG